MLVLAEAEMTMSKIFGKKEKSSQEDDGLKNQSRRSLVMGAMTAFASGLTVPALAENRTNSIIDVILNSKNRDRWSEKFDARSATKKSVASSTPIFAPQTVQYVEEAIATYQNISLNGGWPVVPASKKLRIGASDSSVKVLRRRLMISGDLSSRAGLSNQFDTYVDAAVKRFQRRHGLPPDGVLGRYSFAALNVSADIRLGQLNTNLVRLRAMSGFLGQRYVMVNIPAAQIEAVENDRVAQRHTAIVGRKSRQTPILNSKIYELNLNPYWNAPVSIVRRDIIPLMQKNPKYLTQNKIRIFDRNKNELDPTTVDWNTDEAVNYHFRQDPSKINAMGTVKINFPNPHAVYMHDTPQKSLFGKLLRFDSSGCVRVQNVRDLLVWLAKDTPNWNRRNLEQVISAGDRTDLKLANPVPVYFTYVTAWSTQGGVVQFRDDIYERDGVDELALSNN